MGEASYLQTSFLGGEWSQTYQGRMDDPHYRTAMSACLNAFPTETGAWTRRGGSQFLSATRAGGKGRVISFDIEESQPYALCFTDAVLRFISLDAAVSPNPSGIGYVTTNDQQAVLGISTANPAVIQTTTAHGWSTGNTVVFANFGPNPVTSMPILQNRQFTITVVDTTHFSLQDAITGANINGSAMGSFVSATVARILELTTTYLNGAWSSIVPVQAETTDILLNGTQPQILTMTTPPATGVDATFSLSPSDFLDGPYLDPFIGSIVTYSGTQGNITLTFSFQAWSSSVSYDTGDYVVQGGQGYQSVQPANLNNTPPNATWWKPVNGGAPVGPNGFGSGDIGRHVRLFSEPPAWVVGTTYATGAVVGYPGNGAAGTTYWVSLANSNTGNIPGSDIAAWALVTGAAYAQWTWGRVISVSGSGLIAPVSPNGNMTLGGGAAAAFDGNVNKNFGACALSAVSSAPAYAPFLLNTAYSNGALVYGNNGSNYACGNTFSLYNGTLAGVGSYLAITPVTFFVGSIPAGHYFFYNGGNINQPSSYTDFGLQGVTNTNVWNSLGTAPSLATPAAIIGQDFGGSPKIIQQATIFPSNDFGLASNLVSGIAIYLVGSQTPSGGTVLGFVTGPNTVSAITIPSSDTTTAWRFVWFEIFVTTNAVLPYNGTNTFQQQVAVAQAEFFSPNINNGSVITLQVVGPALLYSAGTIINTWQAGVFANSTGWPTCGCYHEGRLWLAGAVANRWDASQSNDIFTFSPTGPDGTVADNNGITFTADADGVNTTFWMATDALGIIIGTEGGEWLLQSTTQGLPITPSNVQAHRVTKVKCAPIEPQRCEHTLVGVQKQQRKIVEWFADVFSGKFTAPNLMDKSRHLSANLIAEIRYANEITPVIWMRDEKGLLFGCTYKRDTLMTSQGPTFYGWHRQVLGSGRSVESITVLPSSSGALDALVMVTNDPATNVRHIEMLNSFFEETDNYQNAWLLDDAVIPSSYSMSNASMNMTVNGLWHLNGKTVTVFAAGLDCGLQDNVGTISDFTVTNGSITVPFGDSLAAGSGAGQLTAAFVNQFGIGALGNMPIVVGFTYTSQAQILRPVSPAESGARAGPAFGKKRRTHRFAVQVIQTNGLSIGTDFSKLQPIPFRPVSGAVPVLLPNLYSGVFQGEIRDDFTYDGQICWQISRPVPGLIAAIGGFVDTADV